MFKKHIWMLKHYSVLASILSFLVLKIPKKKKYAMKKNMLNNLQSMIIKNQNKEIDGTFHL